MRICSLTIKAPRLLLFHDTAALLAFQGALVISGRNVLFKYTHYGVAEALNSGKNQPRTPFIPVDIFIAG